MQIEHIKVNASQHLDVFINTTNFVDKEIRCIAKQIILNKDLFEEVKENFTDLENGIVYEKTNRYIPDYEFLNGYFRIKNTPVILAIDDVNDYIDILLETTKYNHIEELDNYIELKLVNQDKYIALSDFIYLMKLNYKKEELSSFINKRYVRYVIHEDKRRKIFIAVSLLEDQVESISIENTEI